MIFNTWTFGLFALAAIFTYWGAVPQRWKPQYLVIVGTVFYTWSVPAYTLLIAALGIVTYAIGGAMLCARGERRRSRLLALGCVIIVGILFTFKYTHFIAVTIDQVAARRILPVPQLLVPLAISFFTFEFVHVLVDIRLGKIDTLDPLDFAVFTMFFPTLVAGPIKRFQSFAPQVQHIVPPSSSEIALHLYRVIIGVSKKMILADSMTILSEPLLHYGAPYGWADYWIGMLAYAAKIYFDFSGYSDIAIGTAGLLGIAIPENFERPYWASNISSFWNRWHISLSTWIRDYVFIPLGGSRRPPIIVLTNLLIAMALSGLWHGASWTFVVWGLWHGVGLAIHRVWSRVVVARVRFLSAGGPLVTGVSVVTTFGFVAFGWVLFAATSLDAAGNIYRTMAFR